MWARLKLFLNPFDARFEDLRRGSWHLVVLRDFSAGLIVAMMAIPLAMGFAMASGLKPEQGIVGGAVAGLVGALFGGSKYQVYGPTAAFIPVIFGLMAAYATPMDPYAGHGFLVLASVCAGIILIVLGLTGQGKWANKVPHSIVVGFTIGIAVTIATSQVSEVFGLSAGFKVTEDSIALLKKEGVPDSLAGKLEPLKNREFATRKQFLDEVTTTLGRDEVEAHRGAILKSSELKMPSSFFKKVKVIAAHLGEFNGDALLLALVTFLITQYMLRLSIYVPAPLIAIGIGIMLSRTLLNGHELALVRTKFGPIPTDFLVITPPTLPAVDLKVLRDLAYFVVAIVFVSGVESLLCSRMADRLADNRGTPFNPNKEFWGQGLVQVLVPFFNGFPHTGALARTATNIKVGAVTPLAGIFKFALKLMLAYWMASYLEIVPMACIGGILMWVAFNMVKPAEIKQVWRHNWFHVVLMAFTAIMVIITDFLIGVLSAMIVYLALFWFLDRSTPVAQESKDTHAQPDVPPAYTNGQMEAPQTAVHGLQEN